jgi:hypothetical protein
LPEQAPSVHTSSAPSTLGMSGRGAVRFGRAVGAPPAEASFAASAHATCAHTLPDFAISSPGWMRDEQTPQEVAYFAVIGTRPP